MIRRPGISTRQLGQARQAKSVKYWESSAALWQREARPYKSFGWRPQKEAAEAGTGLQREQDSLPVALQKAKQRMGEEVCVTGDCLKSIGNKGRISGWFYSSRRSSVKLFLNKMGRN